MKAPRSLLLALCALSLAAGSALRAADEKPAAGSGERGGGRGERGERMQQMGDRLAEALGLSEDQKAKMKAINEQERVEIEALRNSSDSKEDGRAKAREVHEKYKAQRDAILTPEQKAKADEFRSKMKGRWEGRGEGKGEGRPEGGRRQKGGE